MNTVSQKPGLFLTVNVEWKDLTLGLFLTVNVAWKDLTLVLPGLFVQP